MTEIPEHLKHQAMLDIQAAREADEVPGSFYLICDHPACMARVGDFKTPGELTKAAKEQGWAERINLGSSLEHVCPQHKESAA